MQRGVQSHQCMAAVPIDLERERLANLRRRRAAGRNMHDAVERIALAGVGYRNALAAGTQERAAVAHLSAALWIEDGAIELDTAFMHSDDARARALQVGIVSE